MLDLVIEIVRLSFLIDPEPLEIKDVCKPNPCQNDGVCKPEGERDFQCACKEGYKGKTCQGEFPSRQSINLGKTTLFSGTFSIWAKIISKAFLLMDAGFCY